MMHDEISFDEVASRPMSALHLTSMLCPGVVWITKGYVLRAILVHGAFVFLWILYALIWAVWKFSPLVPTLWFALMWGVLLYLNARDAARAPMLRDVPVTPFVNGILSFFTWFVPLVVVALLFLTAIGSWMPIVTGSMFPTAVPGDVVWVDRSSYAGRWPEYGDVIVYTHPKTQKPRVGRVVGLPGDYISFKDGELVSSGGPVSYHEIPESQGAAFFKVTGVTPDAIRARYEVRDRIAYPISGLGRADAAQKYNGHEWFLSDSEIFILNDNRGYDDDSRSFGPIEHQQLVGMPLYVIWSRAKSDHLRRVRTGGAVQHPRFAHIDHDDDMYHESE